jgi:hypothetical protein
VVWHVKVLCACSGICAAEWLPATGHRLHAWPDGAVVAREPPLHSPRVRPALPAQALPRPWAQRVSRPIMTCRDLSCLDCAVLLFSTVWAPRLSYEGGYRNMAAS